jgi:nucleoid-associated protein EbfC
VGASGIADSEGGEVALHPGKPSKVQQLAEHALAVQQRLVTLRNELSQAELTGKAGDGLVKVTMRGTGEAVRVRIDRAVADPYDVATLEGLLLAAIGDAQQAIRTFIEERKRTA